jgi:hypothetical protein
MEELEYFCKVGIGDVIHSAETEFNQVGSQFSNLIDKARLDPVAGFEIELLGLIVQNFLQIFFGQNCVGHTF